MADVLNTLGQKIIPSVFSKLNGVGLTDTMTIKRRAASAGAGGGRVKGSVSNAYTGVYVDVTPRSSNSRLVQGDKPRSLQEYVLEFPTHDSSEVRIAVDIKTDRFVVDARGNEPAKTFRAITIPEDHGVVYQAICVRENDE